MDQMATELASLLQGTLSPDANVRPEAEARLKAAEGQKGYISSLFKLIAVMDGVPIEIRQSGSIYLKNMVRRSWDHSRHDAEGMPGNRVRIEDDEKAVIRDNLLEALVHADPKVRPQVAETLKSVVMVDFPQSWPGLIPSMLQNLQTGEDMRVLAALIALRNIAKVYEFKPEKEGDREPRRPLNTVVEVCFPKLLELNLALERRLTESGGMDEFAHMLQRYICKTFWSATEYFLPPYILNSEDNFRMWMEALVTALRRPVSAQAIEGKTDPDDLLQVPGWKVKKWLGHIMHRYFQRYGDPKAFRGQQTSDPVLIAFAEKFLNNYAAPITSAMLEVLSWPKTLGTPVSPRVANLALNYIDAAIVPAVTYNVLQPNVQTLLTEIVFPYLCINDADALLWETEPVEYVRKAYDVLEDFYSPRAAACNVVFTLGKLRARNTIMPFLEYLADILNKYAAAPDGSPEKDALARRKDGVLLAIGYVKEKLLGNDTNKGNLKSILMGHVQPEFRGNYPFLRARTCWLFGQLASTSSDIMLSHDVLLPALQGVLSCFNDSDFPVRVQAGVDIRFFLTNETAAQAIRPVLQDLFDHLFRLIDQVDCTDIIATIEALVQRFHEDIPPFAGHMCDKLANAYLRAASSSDDDEESNLAAVQCLQAIDTILQSLACATEVGELFRHIEPVLGKIFNVMFDLDKMEFFEESLDVLSTLISFSAESNSVSPYLWSIFPRIFEAFHKWAFDYAVKLIRPIDHYITLDTDTFLSGSAGNVTYVECVVKMIDKLWQEEHDDVDAEEGTKLAEILILNCKPRIDTTVQQILAMVIRRMNTADTDQLRARLLANIGCALYYNPAMTLQVLSQMQCVQAVFVLWLDKIQSFQRIHDKKASAVGLSAILPLPLESLPPEVQAGYSQVLLAVLELLRLINVQRASRDSEHRQHEHDHMHGRELPDVEFDDNQDADDQYSILFRREHYDELDDGFGDEDEGEFDSVLDGVNEVIYFADAMRAMGEERANRIGSALQPEQQTVLHSFLRRADEIRVAQLNAQNNHGHGHGHSHSNSHSHSHSHGHSHGH